MATIYEQLAAVLGPNKKIAEQEPLSEHTLLKKGGKASFYCEIDKVDELVRLAQKARELQIPVCVLGSGAVVSIPEQDITALVIKNLCRRFDKMSMKGKITGGEMGIEKVLISAEAGVLMNQLVRFTIEEGLEGLEYQLGLPGTVGGALITNAEYKQNFVRDCLVSARVIDKDGEVRTYTQKFPFLKKRQEKLRESQVVLLSAIFELKPQDKKVLWERGSKAVEYRSNNG